MRGSRDTTKICRLSSTYLYPNLRSCDDGQVGCKCIFSHMKYHALAISMDCGASQDLLTRS